MDAETKQKIVKWIYDNHEHHANAERVELEIDSDTVTRYEDESECTDGNYPYVNSLELERFIESL